MRQPRVLAVVHRVAARAPWHLCDRRQIYDPNLLLSVLANAASDNVGRDLLEQVLLGLVDLVALGGGGQGDLFVQLLDVGGANVGDLLDHLQDGGELGPQNLVRLDAQRDEGGLGGWGRESCYRGTLLEIDGDFDEPG